MTATDSAPPLHVSEFHERSVLGALLAQPDADHAIRLFQEIAPLLDDDDFFRQEHRKVWYAIRTTTADNRRGCLVGDLFRRPGMNSAFLAGLCADATDSTLVVLQALHVAQLGLDRLIQGGAYRVGTGEPSAAAVEAFNANVQRKRERIDRAREGPPKEGDASYEPLAGR